MIRRDRKIRPAMTHGWLADDIAANVRNYAGLSRRDERFVYVNLETGEQSGYKQTLSPVCGKLASAAWRLRRAGAHLNFLQSYFSY